MTTTTATDAAIITIGFTTSDHNAADGHFAMIDGYRQGDAQERVSIRTTRDALFGFDGFQIAEAVFTATNAPFEVDGIASLIREALKVKIAQGAKVRSLSVGDTVSIMRGGNLERLACADCGFDDLTVS